MIPLRDNIPSRIIPFITWSIIAMNCYVFFLQISAAGPSGFEAFVNKWATIPAHVFSHPYTYWYTLLTATFLHGGWMHIIGNMVFLYIFGDNVEDRMGHVRFFIFYIVAGVLANFSQAFMSSSSTIPLLGASGAIAGVLGAYFFYYPHARVMTLIPLGLFTRVVEVPAFLFLGFWFLMQAFNSTAFVAVQMATKQSSGGVAWLAHASGFIIGLVCAPFFAEKRSRFK